MTNESLDAGKRGLSREELARLVERRKQRAGASLESAAIPRRPAGEEAVPLSIAQARLWLLDRLEPGTTAYNLPVALELRGGLRPAALAAALAEVVRRHEALRTRFVEEAGEPVQRVVPAMPPGRLPEQLSEQIALPLIDLSALPAERSMEEEARVSPLLAPVPFDLASGPLLRAFLLRRDAERHRLTIDLHHIASDGWSVSLLLDELGQLYAAATQGLASPLPELPIQYADFAVWQRRWLTGPTLEGHLAYWRQALAAAPPELDLPADRVRPARQSFRGAQRREVLPPRLTAELRALARREGATLFMVLLAFFQLLLARLAGQDDVVVGAPSAGRLRVETERLIGLFLNTLVLRLDVAGGPSARQLVARSRAAVLGAYAHQEVPFEKLLEELQPERQLQRTPFFQVLFNMLSLPASRLDWPGLAVAMSPAGEPEAKFDLTLYVEEAGDRIAIDAVYARDLFDEARIAEMLRQLAALLEGAVAAPDAAVDRLSLMTAAARAVLPDPAAELPLDWRGGAPAELTRTAAAAPEAWAVLGWRGAGDRWTYRQLEEGANRLAHALRRRGVAKGEVVAIWAHRTSSLVWAAMGVLKAGAVMMIVDAAYPPGRLRDLIRIGRPKALLALAGGAPVPPEVAGELAAAGCTVRLELPGLDDGEPAFLPDDLADCPPVPPDVEIGPRDGACLTFTSGSTGRPKGVLGCHASLSHFNPWYRQTFGLGPDDRFALLSALSHDPLQRDLFATLGAGAPIVVPDGERFGNPGYLARWLRDQRVTVVALTPSSLELVALSAAALPLEERALPALRWAFLVGEQLRRADVERISRLAPNLRCVNLYGATETQRSIGCLPLPRPEEPAWRAFRREVLPVGRGIDGVQLLVRNRAGELAGIGEVGEVAVRSRHLAAGYLGDPELTGERFLANRCAVTPLADDRLYLTGDLGRYLPDGGVEIAGRIDAQLKIRGFRVEPGEIEAVLARLPGVREAVVVLREDRPGDRRLAAYLTGPEVPAPRALREYLAGELPDYMVPAAFVRLERLPLGATGKLDRSALPPPANLEPLAGAAEAALTPVEELLAGLWSEVLGGRPARRDDSFFALGGHSLLGVRLIARVRETLGVELPLRALFERPTLAGLAAAVEAARRDPGLAGIPGMAAEPPLAPIPRGGPLPLSFAQRRLWFLSELDSESPAYNLFGALRAVGDLSVPALAAALGEIARRQETLRTTFHATVGEPEARVAPPAPVPLPQVDLAALGAAVREGELARLLGAEAVRPFELARGPLFRVLLVRLAAGERALAFGLHHVVADGWSLGVLVRELDAAYRAALAGRPSPLAEPAVQYADYAAWLRGWMSGAVMERQLAFWRGALEGAPRVLDLPADRPRPAVAGHRGARVVRPLPPPLGERVSAAARQLGVTPFMLLCAAFAAVLGRGAGQSDLVLGVPVANRRRETEELIGLFTNALALRVELAPHGGRPSFAALAAAVRASTLAAHAHQDLPFERLVDELQPERDLSRSPLFQVLFGLQNQPAAHLELPGLTLSDLPVAGGRAPFDLDLSLLPEAGSYRARLDYSTELFDEATVERLLDRFATLLAGAVADPVRPVAELPLLAPAEVELLWRAAHGPRREPPAATLAALWARSAARFAARTAVLHAGESLTYGELDAWSSRLALRLRELGVGAETPVGICLDRSLDLVAALLAVLKAGGAYVPLDPGYPAERLAFIAADSGLRLALSHGALGARVADVLPPGARMIEVVRPSDLGAPPPPLAPIAEAEGLAYVLYTSGSTGRPKGVEVRHRGVVSFLAAMAEEPGITPDDLLLAVTTISFDISVLEIFLPLAAGARVEIVAREVAADGTRLAALLARSGATMLQATPATWRALLAAEWAGSPALRALCGGEAMPPELALELVPRVGALWNVYGPTETTVWSAVERVVLPVAAGRAVPVGRPIANTAIHLLDGELRPVPPGSAGGLYIGGAGLARGYRGRPDLTAERFLPDPFAAPESGGPGGRLYFTGDVARLLPDGRLDFLGRVDHQVKLRGFRIEPGEIEAALEAFPAVRQAVVLLRRDGPAGGGSGRLVAFYAPREGSDERELSAPLAAIRAALLARLPEYMVPQLLVPVAALPLTPNGKVDRRALETWPLAGGGEERVYREPGSAAERDLAAIWRAVLGVERIGLDDDFFALGGDSILTIQVVVRAKGRGLQVTPRQLFQHPTLGALAATIVAVPTADLGVADAGSLVSAAELDEALAGLN
jgi:amino acid adenylation domain-containing protein